MTAIPLHTDNIPTSFKLPDNINLIPSCTSEDFVGMAAAVAIETKNRMNDSSDESQFFWKKHVCIALKH